MRNTSGKDGHGQCEADSETTGNRKKINTNQNSVTTLALLLAHTVFPGKCRTKATEAVDDGCARG